MPVQPVFSEAAFRQTLSRADASTVIVVDFYAEWCGPCHALAPRLEALSREYDENATFLKVDVDKLPQISGQYGVSAMPTIVFIKRGATLDKVVGADIAAIRSCLQRFYEPRTRAFSGSGQRLGGTGGNEAPLANATRTSRLVRGGGSDVGASSGASAAANQPNTAAGRAPTDSKLKPQVKTAPSPEPKAVKTQPNFQNPKHQGFETPRITSPSDQPGQVELQVRMPDGTVLRNAFSNSDTLLAVKEWVAAHVGERDAASGTAESEGNGVAAESWGEYLASWVPGFVRSSTVGSWLGLDAAGIRGDWAAAVSRGHFALATTFPRRVFRTPDQLSRSLAAENLRFRAQLIVLVD